MSDELEILIDKLRRAQNIIWEVDDILRKKKINSMLSYCEDYTSITIKELKKQRDKNENRI